ncbi:unnamed protein product [Trifolium pratense]|uniref:Uncharacterized protein n=1 Tax=Trifolium pratense TaxID=57577 RepID=A0ACB0LZ83_TRIPR|nr:unnamed protein product [Trifolium pratense]
MSERSKELLQFEHKASPLSSLESALLVCDNNTKETNSQTKRLPTPRTSFTSPLPPSQFLGKVKDFLGVMSEANKRLEHDAKDHPEKYDIEGLTGKESKVIEMDLMLGVADLHTPEAVAAAESAISGCQPVISLPADGSESDSEEESSAADDNCEMDCNDGKKSPSLDQKPISDIHRKPKGHRCSKIRRFKKRPSIVELS